ncbi:hypothetical protein [Litchfieldia alkalitelluris]|uniref:hypothetical protein n=1 Tax=Litchfieldia alkalitelluris TaxID=304268 RepID=UPI0009961752|nr:hypothetical protein [Litchfieldia alkalitelluris]
MIDYSSVRRPKAYISQFSTTQLHLRNPFVVAFFSFSYPGFGNLMLHRYAKAFVLIGWEIFINQMANLNLAIMYSLLGDFSQAKDVVNERWLILYVGIYMFSIWDTYRSTVDLNKLYILADNEDAPITPMIITPWDINFLDKRSPGVAAAWSILIPGLGHLYVHKVITGFFIFGYSIAIMYFSHIPLAIKYTMVGEFAKATSTLDMQWTLYLPSIYIFIIYDAYISAVEYNKLFEKEMTKYLRTKFQSSKFKFPI